ncbi:hypothetical protein JCM3774_000342 [Rhodotorula dairenensis]
MVRLQSGLSTPRSTAARAATAATTPHRRSQIELLDQLNSLFDSLDASASSSASASRPTSPLLLPSAATVGACIPSAPRTATLRLVPALLDAFDEKRGIQLLDEAERTQLRALVQTLPDGVQDQPVGVEQLFELLVGLGVTQVAPSSSSAFAGPVEGTRSSSSLEASTAAGLAITTTPTGPPPRDTPPPPTTTSGTAMLRPDAESYRTGDGSPTRRSRSTTTPSTWTRASGGIAGPSNSNSGPSLSGSHIPVPVSKRRTAVPKSSESESESESAAMGGLAPTTAKTSPRKKTLRRRRTEEDLARLERQEQESGYYLGVALDRQHGQTRATGGFQGSNTNEAEDDDVVGTVAKKVKAVLSSKGPTRQQDLLALLAPLSHAHLQALYFGYAAAVAVDAGDESKEEEPRKTLLEIILADRGIKGTAELALRGVLMGPLAFDVYLVQKALEGAVTDDALLIELLVGRSPSSLASLRLAFDERPLPLAAEPRPSTTTTSRVPVPAAAGGSGKNKLLHTRALDVAVLSAYSGNTRVRKAWEVALKGRWADLAAAATVSSSEAGVPGAAAEGADAVRPREEGEQDRSRLLEEDLEQLKKALRRGGSTDTIAKILLARSPVHLRLLSDEFALSTADGSSLTRAIKQSVPAGVLQRMFLHTVHAARRVSDTFGYGVWRDAKTLQRVVEADKSGAKRDEFVVVQLLRLRGDQTRFGQVQGAFELKYGIPLADRLRRVWPPGHAVAETTRLLLEVQTGPGRVHVLDDATGSATSTLQLDAPNNGGSDASSDRDPAELEAQGELSDPTSPRSPPATAIYGDTDSGLLDTLGNGQRGDASFPGNFARSTSSQSSRREASVDRPSSALSSRSQSSAVGESHRPSSSASVHQDTSRLSSSLRHSRPMAPSRAKRRQSEELARSQRSGSAESLPLSPRADGALSPTWSHASRGSLSRSDSTADDDWSASLASSVTSSQHNSHDAQPRHEQSHNDGMNAIDTSSFFATPLSPIRDESRPSSTFFPDNRASTPPPTMFPPDESTDLFATVTGTPDSPERYFASLMRRNASQTSSTSASSHFGDGLLDSFLLASPGGHAPDGSGTVRGNEQFQQLLRHAHDLAKKLKDNESRFHASASQFESEVADLEGQLEEARSELLAKRREEKELRSIEKEHLQQISLLEGEVANLNKSLERSREAYDVMKRSYTSTCEEADRLRALVADLRRENRNSEEAIQGHSLQVQEFERDHQRLQQAVEKLEGELAAARQAQDALDDQKQENLMLKETIDKLRFEIEEMRSVGPRSAFLESGQNLLSPSKSLAATISRSIGREIATHMTSDDEDDSEGEEASEHEEAPDDIDDIIVTTHRRIRKRGKRSTGLSEPIVHISTSVNMTDADCQTLGPRHSVLGVQTDLTALNADLVEVRETIEEPRQPELTTRRMQDELATRLGVDVDLFKQLADAKQAGVGVTVTTTPTEMLQPVAVPSRRSSHWQSRLAAIPALKAPAYLVNIFPSSARPYVAQLLDSGLSLVLCTAAVYLFGVLSGSTFIPMVHRHYPSPADFALYPSYSPRWEGLVVGAGVDGGYAPEGFARIFHK